ncbi:MAG: 50S ribosomal protein L6 [Alphaproteobacteria bacterium]|nr:50S ribosomal protein L6 [Alphaproteobacteria bacterium]
MSRVGKYPVEIPQGVQVAIAGRVLTAKGKLGELKLDLHNDVEAKVDGSKVWVKPAAETKRARTLWGTTRSLVNGMVRGVSQGFAKVLEIEGVGFRASIQGKNLMLSIGYSHEVVYPIPAGITIKVTGEKPPVIRIEGASKQQVGQVASEIRAFRGPEPYKGKGIRYEGEQIRRKEGKKK